MTELYAGLIAAGLFIAGAIASYFKGKKIAEDKAELKASKDSLFKKAEEDKERNAGIKIMSDNALRERADLISRMQSKPDQGSE